MDDTVMMVIRGIIFKMQPSFGFRCDIYSYTRTFLSLALILFLY